MAAGTSRGLVWRSGRGSMLLAADGVAVKDIVERVGVSKPTVIGWKKRYTGRGAGRVGGSAEAGTPSGDRRGRCRVGHVGGAPRAAGRDALVEQAAGCRAGHLACLGGQDLEAVGTAGAVLAVGAFKFSTDPQLEAKIRDVVGLYLNPPDKAIVLCVDEKSQVQALDRTAPTLPMRLGMPERQTHDYVRHGTTTLFAALEIATGHVEQACLPRHRHQEFLRFLKQVAKAYPRRKLHLVVDNYATHNHPAVRAWLARNPRITLHFTPTSGSWLNLVEIFFSIITRQAIRRGSFGSVKDLIAAIGAFIDGWNERCHPFVWTKAADDLLDHCRPGQFQGVGAARRTSVTGGGCPGSAC